MRFHTIYKYLILIFILAICGEFVVLKNIFAQNKFALNKMVLGEKELNLQTDFRNLGGSFYQDLKPIDEEKLALIFEKSEQIEVKVQNNEPEESSTQDQIQLNTNEEKVQEIVEFLDQGVKIESSSNNLKTAVPINKVQQIIDKNKKIYNKIMTILEE